MTTPTETLIKALRILASDIQSEDGIANTAILEAAQRMEEDQEVIFQAGESIKILRQTVKHRNETIDELKQRIKRMEKLGDQLYETVGCGCGMSGPCKSCREATDKWDEYKEAKP
jgi:bacterioferritin (cytochrome b1)